MVPPVIACSIRSPTVEEVAQNASVILRVLITEVKLIREPGQNASKALVEAKYEVMERLKGTVPAIRMVRVGLSQPGECGGFFFLAGTEYILAINESRPNARLFGTEVLLPEIPGSQERLRKLRSLTLNKR